MLYLRCYIRIVLYKTAGSGKIKDQEEWTEQAPPLTIDSRS
jgi:hypothetical protein